MLTFGIFLAILGMLGLGTGDFLAGISSRKIGDKLSLFIIFGIQTLAAFVYWLIFQHSLDVNLILTTTILIAGVFQAFGLMLFYKAMSLEKISLVSPIFAIYSLLTVFFGIFILHEIVTGLKILAISAVILGTIFASTDFSFFGKKINFLKSKGIQTALLGMIFFAVAFLLMTIVFKYSEFYFTNTLYSLSTFVTAIFLLRKNKENKKKTFSVIPLLVGVMYASANVAIALCLKYIPTSYEAAITAAFPAITALCGLVFLKEKLSLSQKIGIVGIIGGLILLAI